MKSSKLPEIISKEDKYIKSYIETLNCQVCHIKSENIKELREYFMLLCNVEYSFKQLTYYVVGIRQNLFFFGLKSSNINENLKTLIEIDNFFLSHENNILEHLKNIKKEKKITINNINKALKINIHRVKK